MSKVLKINKSTEEGVRELLKFLLKEGKVKGVFTLEKSNENSAVDYSLITSLEGIKNAVPFFPLMPANAGKLLSRLTLKEPLAEPIAAVLRPCELRAFIELVKREQGSLENFLFISSTCGGVYPLKMSANGDLTKELPKYYDAIKKAELPSEIRPTCKACENFVPSPAQGGTDITITLVGKDPDKCEIFLNTAKAEKLVDGIEGNFEEVAAGFSLRETEEVKKFLSKRKEEKKKLFAEAKIEGFGLKGLIETFGKCIGCRGCNRVCPICYCTLCDFDSRDHEYEPSTYETELKKRGGVRVPPNTVFYQIGRLTHVGISCVGCGMCADVCPADIPLSTIFLKVGEEIQKVFNYIPGKDVEEKIPFTTFEKEELHEVEE